MSATAAANGSTKTKDPSVKALFDTLPPELSIAAIVRCGDKTEKYSVEKTSKTALNIIDNELAFERTKLELSFYKNKAFIKVTAKSTPMELALHTLHGRAYVSSEDGITFKSIAEGDVKIVKTAKGVVEIKTASSVCAIV